MEKPVPLGFGKVPIGPRDMNEERSRREPLIRLDGFKSVVHRRGSGDPSYEFDETGGEGHEGTL